MEAVIFKPFHEDITTDGAQWTTHIHAELFKF